MIEAGEIIRGAGNKNWVISHRLGSGKCCDVYAANLQGCEDEKVAIKVYKTGESYEWACRREACLLRLVCEEQGPQPQLVSVKESGVHKGCHYLIEEQLSLSLSQILLKTGEDGVTIWLCQKLARDIIRALSILHTSGFVHGDLKANNLMWSAEDGRLKLIDFGLSFHVDDQDVGRVQSPGYQAPEVVIWNSGAACRTKLTPSIDMWSMGCLLLWMLSGQKLPQTEERRGRCENCSIADGKESCKYGVIAGSLIQKHTRERQREKDDLIDLIMKSDNDVRDSETDSGLDAFSEDQERIWLCTYRQLAEVRDALQEISTMLLNCCPSERLSASQALDHSFFSTVLEPVFRDLLILPTSVLRLVNAVDSVDLQDLEGLKEIQEDIELECRKFGAIERCVIPREGLGGEKVFVKYIKPEDAEKAFEKLNGRVFNDRTVITTFFCTEAFKNQQYY